MTISLLILSDLCLEHAMKEIKYVDMSQGILKKFVMNIPEVAHIKNAEKGQYIICNHVAADFYGLNDPEQIEGLTIDDIGKLMSPYWSEHQAKKIVELDSVVVNTGEPVSTDNDVLLTRQGFVRVQHVTKLPLVAGDSKTIAILTICKDITKSESLPGLWERYKILHNDKTHGSSCFLKYLSVDHFIAEDLAEDEVKCLLHLHQSESSDHIANVLGISNNDALALITKFKNKTKTKDLSGILAVLRKN